MKGAGTGAGTGADGVGGAEEEGAEVPGPLALVLRVPRKVIVRSSGFQQFFWIYAKLMVGLRDSKVRELDTTPLAMHKAVMSAGKPSREELDWAIYDIWPEMSEPKSISIFITSP